MLDLVALSFSLISLAASGYAIYYTRISKNEISAPTPIAERQTRVPPKSDLRDVRPSFLTKEKRRDAILMRGFDPVVLKKTIRS